jgi:type IV pilus assembly protein PilF
VHMRLNNDALAEASFRRALQLRPRDPDALHNLGGLLCQHGRHAEGIGFLTQALAVPAYAAQARTWMAQGLCQLRLGQWEQAEHSLRRSHELDATHPVAAYNLAALLHRRGEDQQARSYIQALNNSNLANAQTLWLGVRVERRLRNTATVDQLAQQLGQRYPQSPEWALYQRGAFDE